MNEAVFDGVSIEPFWTFSCAFYARPFMATTCLQLQEEFGADVNVLLFGLYVARLRRRLSSQDFEHLDLRCRQWRDAIVRPLRAVRRALKNASLPQSDDALRRTVAEAELEAERRQHAILANIGAPLGLVAEANASLREIAVGNVEAYAAFCPAGRFASKVVTGLAESLAAMDV